MAISGLGWTTLDVDDSGGTPRDIRSDVTNLDYTTPREIQDVTGLDMSASARIKLLADFQMNTSGTMNFDVNKSHDVLKDLVSTEVSRTITHAIAGVSMVNECHGTDYKVNRDTSGAFTWETPWLLANGVVPVYA